MSKVKSPAFTKVTAGKQKLNVVSGTVLKGLGLGKKLGAHTLNLLPSRVSKKVKFGVYAVTVKPPIGFFKGVAHYGPRPTVNAPISFEIHCFGLKKNLYGKKVEVEVIKRLRSVKNFRTLEALQKQIEKDKSHALKIFSAIMPL